MKNQKQIFCRVLFVCVATVICFTCSDKLRAELTQTNSTNGKNIGLWPLMPALGLTTLESKMSYELISQKKPVSAKEVISDLNDFLSEESTKKDRVPEILERDKLFEKNKDALLKLFGKFNLIGDQAGQFVYTKKSLPIYFVSKDDSIALLVSGAVSEAAFNTQRTTAKTRAAKIISSMVLPSLKEFQDACSGTDIQEFGLSVVYGSKDFADTGSVMNLKPEVVVFFVNREKCKQFVEAKITEDELVKSADIYQADRDMVTGIKKITVNLE